MPRNLIDITDLSVEEIDQLIATAEDIIANPAKYQDVCAHKQLATLFFEPSTRTRLSFESAMLALGGSTLGFSEASSSSTAKGETVGDTIQRRARPLPPPSTVRCPSSTPATAATTTPPRP